MAEGRFFVGLALLLAGIRFSLPTVFAALPSPPEPIVSDLAAAFGDLSASVLFGIALLVIASWPGGFRWDIGSGAALAFAIVAVVLWAGEVDPSWRLSSSSWSAFLLGSVIAAAIAAAEGAFESRLSRTGVSGPVRREYRAFGLGFAIAYFLRSARLLDYAGLLGGAPLEAWLRVLDYAPILILVFLAGSMWFRRALPRDGIRISWQSALGAPAVGAVLGIAVALGLGGFYVSSATTWGGSYTLFPPAVLSLAIVGFAVGSVAATARVLHHALSAARWRCIVGGVVIAALSGLLAFRGSLGSLAGIVLALALVARGIQDGTAGAAHSQSKY